MFVRFFIKNLAYPIWLVTNATSGVLAKAVRNVCYYGLEKKTSWLHPIDKLHSHMDTTATCEGVSDFVFNSRYAKVGYVVGTGLFAYHQLQCVVREREYKDYKQKSKTEIQNLNRTQIHSFDIGVQSAKSKLNRIVGWGKYEAWCAPKAFWAGFGAGLHDDKMLISKVLAHQV